MTLLPSQILETTREHLPACTAVRSRLHGKAAAICAAVSCAAQQRRALVRTQPGACPQCPLEGRQLCAGRAHQQQERRLQSGGGAVGKTRHPRTKKPTGKQRMLRLPLPCDLHLPCLEHVLGLMLCASTQHVARARTGAGPRPRPRTPAAAEGRQMQPRGNSVLSACCSPPNPPNGVAHLATRRTRKWRLPAELSLGPRAAAWPATAPPAPLPRMRCAPASSRQPHQLARLQQHCAGGGGQQLHIWA